MGKQSALALLLMLFLACAAFAVAYLFLPKSATAQPEGWEISVSLEGSRPFVSGNNATLAAFSTCGKFELYSDGELILPNATRVSMPFALQAGHHYLSAKGQGCEASVPFEVLARECESGQTRACTRDGCEGVQHCQGGIYPQSCSLPKKICVPGERMGCSTDGCKFGYATCNACGTGFGKCLPGSSAGVSSGCNGGDCG